MSVPADLKQQAKTPLPPSSDAFGAGDVALITGANKGLGFEIARTLGHKRISVIVGARDVARGEEAVIKLRKEGIDASFQALEVTSAASIAAAVKEVAAKYGKLDILVNNAAILAHTGDTLETQDVDTLRRTYEANVFGPYAVAQAFVALLRKSKHPRIVNVSSGMGSLALVSDATRWPFGVREYAYNSSKTALNAITVQLSNELSKEGFKVNSADPGYCATDMNNYQGERTAQQGAIAASHLATLGDDGPTGSFFDDEGLEAW